MYKQKVKYGIDLDLIRETNQSVELGKETLSTLAYQRAQLEKIEDTVDSEAEIIAKSNDIIDRMACCGCLKRFFRRKKNQKTLFKQKEIPLRTYKIEKQSDEERINLNRDMADSNNEKNTRENAMIVIEKGLNPQGKSSTHEKQENVMSAQKQYLNILSGNLYELKELNILASEEIDQQNEIVTSISEKVAQVDEGMRKVTRKAKQLMPNSGEKYDRFRCYVSLQEIETQLYVSVKGEDLILTEPSLSKSCRFAVFERNAQINIVGFKSCVTFRWIGKDIFDKITVKSALFGNNEEFEANLSGNHTPLLLCSANGQDGGYLKYNAQKNRFDIINTNRDNATWFRIINCNESKNYFSQEELFTIEPS